jgi:hypothetical protein
LKFQLFPANSARGDVSEVSHHAGTTAGAQGERSGARRPAGGSEGGGARTAAVELLLALWLLIINVLYYFQFRHLAWTHLPYWLGPWRH